MKKLLITDLDDTLYSWLRFFIPPFYELIGNISLITGIDSEIITGEFRKVHKILSGIENKDSAFLLSSVQNLLKTDKIKKDALYNALDVFEQSKLKSLKLYGGVYKTLEDLMKNGIRIVGFTESTVDGGFSRLKACDIDKFFNRVYMSENPNIENVYSIDNKCTVLKNICKPDPELLKKICINEGFDTNHAVYAGNSLVKDISMANDAGIISVYCNYKEDNSELLDKLYRISAYPRKGNEIINKNIIPDYEINDFCELIGILMK